MANLKDTIIDGDLEISGRLLGGGNIQSILH